MTTPYMTVTFFPAGKMTNLWDIPLERTCCSSSCFRSRRSCTGVWGKKNSPKKLTPASVKQRPGGGMHGTQCRSSYLPRATHVHQQRILTHAVLLLHKLDPSPKPTTNEEESRHRHSAASSGPKSRPILDAEGNQLELILNIREAKPLQILLRLRNAANRSRHMPAATSTPKSHQLRRPARYGTGALSSAACCTPPCCRTCRGISRGRGFGKSGWRTETAFQRRVRRGTLVQTSR